MEELGICHSISTPRLEHFRAAIPAIDLREWHAGPDGGVVLEGPLSCRCGELVSAVAGAPFPGGQRRGQVSLVKM